MTRSKRIVHLVYSFGIGGLEKVVANTITATGDTYEHIVVALTDFDPQFIADNQLNHIKVFKLEKGHGQGWSSFFKLGKLLRRLKPDVLHSYNLATLEYQCIAWLCGVGKRIHAEHGRDISDPKGDNKKYRLLRKLVSPFVHYFVAVSRDLNNWLIDSVGISKRKVVLINNGIDTHRFNTSKDSRVSSAANPFVFGNVARLSPIKNQTNLIHAYRSACALSQDFAENTELKIVGDGPLMEQLQILVADDRHIELVGAKSNMAEVYASLHCFVLSSDAEGTPMTLLEAMASELPVVSTAVGGIADVVDEHCARLVPASDSTQLSHALLDIFKARQSCVTMGQHARSLILASFSQETMLEAYKQLYDG